MKKRLFKMGYSGETVDLNDPKTYRFLPDNFKKLDDIMYRAIGKALVYMDFYPDRKDMFPKRKLKSRMHFATTWDGKHRKKIDFANCGYYQRQRVYKLIENFVKDRKDKFNDKMWIKEQIFLLGEETDNFC